MVREINDKIEIKIKEAPISKVAIYNDKIEIIKGKINPVVISKIDITDHNFKERFISFPMYISNAINSTSRNLYYLDGVSNNARLPIPNDQMYEDQDNEKFIKTHGGCYEGSVITLVQQFINPTMILEFYQRQFNYHTIFQIKVGSRQCANLIVNFSKEDIIYTDYKGNVIDYSQPAIVAKPRDGLTKAIQKAKPVAVQKESNIIITKTND